VRTEEQSKGYLEVREERQEIPGGMRRRRDMETDGTMADLTVLTPQTDIQDALV